MVVGRHKRAVGVFSHRRDVEAALRELRDSDFPMDKVSVITRDADREDIAGADVRDEHGRDVHGNVADRTKADEGATTGAVAGGALGGLTGLLVGLGTLAIPGIGPIMLAGAAATALATTLAGGAIGAVAGSLIGGLIGLGIPEERAREYSDRVSRGHYLVLVEGTDDDIRRAEAILSNRGIEDWGVYDSPDGAAAGVGHRHRAIGVFPHRRDAEAAVDELRDVGFPMSQVYLVARDLDRYDKIPHLTVRDRFDNGFFGFPEDRYHFFHDRFNRGEYLVVVDGTADEIHRAEPILSRRGIQHWGIFDAPVAGRTLGHHHRAVGVFPHRRDAEVALDELRDAGFPMNQVSLIARDLDRYDRIPHLTVRDRFDNRFFGFPEDRHRFFHDRFERGEYLVVVDGTADQIRQAEAILSRRGIQHWGMFDAPNLDRSRTGYVAPGTPDRPAGRLYRAVGVFPHRRDAEVAIRELHDAGFPMSQVSLVGRDTNGTGRVAGGNVADRTQTDEGAKAGAAGGAALGGLGGLLVGLGALAIPGIGPVIAGGALATALATAAAGGAIGAAAGGISGALVGLGIPDDRARLYNDRVNRGDYLVMVEGTEDEIRRADTILSRRGIQDWGVFDVPDDDRYRTTAGTHRTGVGRRRRAVGVFPHRRHAEAALGELRDTGFDMDRVSVVGKDLGDRDEIAGADVHNRATGNKADEGAKGGAATGAALGGLGGLLVGLGALAIPGIGPVIAGGALATALATTVAGGAIGAAAGGLTGALVGLGIPEERARYYNDRVNRGDYLVMVDGTEDELRPAQAILSRHGIQDWGIYDTGDVAPGHAHHDQPDVDRTTGTAYVAPGSPRSRLVSNKRAVGVFPHRRDAELAVRDLSNAGFPMNQVSLVGRDTNGTTGRVAGGNVADRTQTDEGAKAGAAGGAALGGLGGLLVGLGALAIPGIGPVIAGGALATALATTVAGGAIGAAAGGLTGALVGLGIPDNRARLYNDRVNRGDYLVMVDGTEDEIRRAEPILRGRGVQDWDVFDAPESDRTGHVTRHVIEPDTTPGVTTTHDPSVVSGAPDVIIVDHRDQRDRNL